MTKRITNVNLSNAGIKKLELSPEVHDEMIERTFKALRKFSTSKKTRSVHKILTNKILIPAIFSGGAAEYLISGTMKNNALRFLSFNLYFFDDSLDRAGAVGYATKLENLDNKIQKEKTFLSDKQIFNIEQLKTEKKELSDKFLNSIDYIKLVDGTYFGWLLTLSEVALEKESLSKPKIVVTVADILASVLKKMYLQVNNTMEPEVHQLLEAISIYFIRIYYYGESAQYVIKLMELGFNDEVLEVIKKTRVTQFKEFNDLSVILKEAQLLPLTKQTFDLQMQKMFGKYGYEYYIQPTLMTFMAFLANLAHPSQLFKDTYGIDDEACERLETLLLNEQKNIKIEKYED